MNLAALRIRKRRPPRVRLAVLGMGLLAALTMLSLYSTPIFGNTDGQAIRAWREEPAGRMGASGRSAAAPALPPRDWRDLRRIRLAGPYPAELLQVIDGDTFVARVPVWLGQDVITRVRLRGVDTPELKGRCARETAKAREAAQAAGEFLRSGPVMLTDIGTGKYAGRVIARVAVTRPDSRQTEDLGALLLAGGYARRYSGGRRGNWCN